MYNKFLITLVPKRLIRQLVPIINSETDDGVDISEPAKETVDTEDLLSTEDSKSNVLDDSQDVEVEPDTSELEEKGKKVGKLESFKLGSLDLRRKVKKLGG